LNSPNRKPIISIIPYLNARPLTRHLLGTANGAFATVEDIPSVSCAKLAEGQVDAGLISSILIPESDQIDIVDGVCIASEGPVESVLLFSEKPLEKISQVLLDPASRTSNVLIRILMNLWIGQDCAFVSSEGTEASDVDDLLKTHESVLAIGDRAFQYALDNPSMVAMDLAMEWKHFTGLPFVFAVWGLRRDSGLSPDIFREARDQGTKQIDTITEEAIREMGLAIIHRRLIQRYLTENLHYRLGSRERKALFLFFRYAAELGLVQEASDIRFR